MAGSSAHVNDFLLGRDNGEGLYVELSFVNFYPIHAMPAEKSSHANAAKPPDAWFQMTNERRLSRG
jgi:hypothetical protein